MRCRNKAEQNLRNAEDLGMMIKQSEVRYGCLPIALRALGGFVHYYLNFIGQKDQMTKLSIVSTLGLDVGGFVEVGSEVTGNFIDSLLDMLYVERQEGEEEREIVGYLAMVVYPEDSFLNHYFAIIPQERMSPLIMRTIVRERKFYVADSNGDTIVGKAHVDDLADYFNGVINLGGTVTIMQIH